MISNNFDICSTCENKNNILNKFKCGCFGLCDECFKLFNQMMCSKCRIKNFNRYNAAKIHMIHNSQTIIQSNELKQKYESPILGKIMIWDLIWILRQCIDESDGNLKGINQLQHVLQVVEELKNNNCFDDDILFTAAITHDLGKLITVILPDEDPANVMCLNKVLSSSGPGCGLDNCIIQYNHDEFIYSRIKDYVPYEVSWIVRYHSLNKKYDEYMNDNDIYLWNKYMIMFRKCDLYTKKADDVVNITKLYEYKNRIMDLFPEPINF